MITILTSNRYGLPENVVGYPIEVLTKQKNAEQMSIYLPQLHLLLFDQRVKESNWDL